MATKIANITKLTLYTNWCPDGETHTFAAPSGAVRFVKNMLRTKDGMENIRAFAIEDMNWFLCNEDQPDGKLYGSPNTPMQYIERKEFDTWLTKQ